MSTDWIPPGHPTVIQGDHEVGIPANAGAYLT